MDYGGKRLKFLGTALGALNKKNCEESTLRYSYYIYCEKNLIELTVEMKPQRSHSCAL